MQNKPCAELELSETAHRVLRKAACSGNNGEAERMAVLCGIEGNHYKKGSDFAESILGKLRKTMEANAGTNSETKSIKIDRAESAFLLYNVHNLKLPETYVWFPEALYMNYVLGIENYQAAAAETISAINQLRKSLRCIVDELTAAENAEGA